MGSMRRSAVVFVISALAAYCALPVAVRAQATPMPAAAATAPAATPAPLASPTFIDREYDGRTHIILAPYVWAPTVGGDFQYQIPNLPLQSGGGAVENVSASVGPSAYLPKLNSAVMFAFDARKKRFDVFGDYIYVNAATSGSSMATLSGPLGRIGIPVGIASSARLHESIWEAAAGFTLARGHNADLSVFAGVRGFTVGYTFDYTATIGQQPAFTRSGSVATTDSAQDVIFGLRGKVYVGNTHFFVPYYGDYGTAVGQLPNQTWQAYGGAGYAFNHGQTVVVLYRALTFESFTSLAHLQKLTMYGPLVGYTFFL